MLYIIGAGLGHLNNITCKAYECLQLSDKVYISESLYCIFCRDVNGFELHEAIGCEDKIIEYKVCQRNEVIDTIFKESLCLNISFLVFGTPYESKYLDILHSAYKKSVPVKIIGNASISSAVGNCGLQLYHFGPAVTLTACSNEILAYENAFLKINLNLQNHLHTLCCFDFDALDQSYFVAGSKEGTYEYASTNVIKDFVCTLLKIVHEGKMCENSFLTSSTLCVGISGLGHPSQKITFQSLNEFNDCQSWSVPFCIVICGEMHPIEKEALDKLSSYYVKHANFDDTVNHTLHFIGLGLGSPNDIPRTGLNAVRRSSEVFLESYTSVMPGGQKALENFISSELIVADREMVEEQALKLINGTSKGDTAFLVVGDPLSATTHIDLLLRALEQNVDVNIFNNATILNSCGLCGLYSENFGETVSIPLWEDSWRPDSFYNKICSNLNNGWHTLCLLDIKVKELDLKELMRGKRCYEAERYMTVSQAASQLLAIYEDHREQSEVCSLTPSNTVIALARVGSSDQKVILATLEEMLNCDLGSPLHSLIIVGEMTEHEKMYTDVYKI